MATQYTDEFQRDAVLVAITSGLTRPKVDEWERFYNFARPHGAHNHQTPYEALRDRLQ